MSSTTSSGRPLVRKRPVSFGNPALGTYKGCIYTLETSAVEGSLETTAVAPSRTAKPLVEGAESVDCMVAMVGVPPEQVPEGVLNLARAHRPCIDHVRIVIAEEEEKDNDDDEGDDESREEGEAKEPDSSLWPDSDDRGPSRTYVVLFHLLSEEDAATFVEDLNGRPYTSLDLTETCSVFTVVALKGEGGVSLMNPMFAPSTKTSHRGTLEILPSASSHGEDEVAQQSNNATKDTKTPSNKNQSSHLVEDTNCPVCLEHMSLDPSSEDKTSILTTVCNHTFHLDCLAQCQDSPCPVCRYDHSGLNEALSQCHVCGTTERNYVCLICGVVSCVGNIGMPTTVAAAASFSDASNQLPDVSAEAAQQLHRSHAGQHYDQTLHAYALDTETQHVWDFAGQGYVHRLLQNKEDGKLVEGNDPNNTTSQERSLTPGLSDTQEGEVVHRKLEGFASQYYTLLKSQLEQQRTFYEGRLEEIRREFAMKRIQEINEKADLISILKQEKKQLAQKLVALKRKRDKATGDVAFLKSMNESLEANKAPLERKIQQVQREQVESREMVQKYLPALEEKVTTLMLQLEESMNTNVAVGSNSGGK